MLAKTKKKDKYRYQLTEWQDSPEKLENAVVLLTKNKAGHQIRCHKVTSCGVEFRLYAVFTTGKKRCE